MRSALIAGLVSATVCACSSNTAPAVDAGEEPRGRLVSVEISLSAVPDDPVDPAVPIVAAKNHRGELEAFCFVHLIAEEVGADELYERLVVQGILLDAEGRVVGREMLDTFPDAYDGDTYVIQDEQFVYVEAETRLRMSNPLGTFVVEARLGSDGDATRDSHPVFYELPDVFERSVLELEGKPYRVLP